MKCPRQGNYKNPGEGGLGPWEERFVKRLLIPDGLSYRNDINHFYRFFSFGKHLRCEAPGCRKNCFDYLQI